jgi:large subunit ribosomal protein L16
MHRGHLRGKATSGNSVDFGDFGLKALHSYWVTARQIEAARVAITRHLRRGGNVWVRVFSDKPVSKKPAETRMGGGKAATDHWVAVVKPGRVMFEVGGVREDQAMEALRLASYKLPMPTKTVRRTDFLASVR